MELVKVDLSLEDFKGRIVSLEYSQDFVTVPLEAFPSNYRNNLQKVYKYITGLDMTYDVDTFKVSSKDGVFKALYTPVLMYDSELGRLVVRWGEVETPLVSTEEGDLFFDNKIYQGLKKPKINFVEDDFGGYKKTLLKIVLPEKDETLVTYIPVRLVDYREKNLADLLELMISNGDFESIANKVADIRDIGQGTSCVGPVIKAGYLPLGVYSLTNYYSYSTKFGDQYNVQAEIVDITDEEGNSLDLFEAVSDIKNEDGVYVPTDVTVKKGEKFVIAGNSTIKTVFKCSPVVSEDKPAYYHISEKGEYNNKPTAKGFIKVSEFIQDEDSFKTTWNK